jgi:hypothetical protein
MPTLLYKGAIRDLRGDDLLPQSVIRDRYPTSTTAKPPSRFTRPGNA